MNPEDTLKKILGTKKLQRVDIGIPSGAILTQEGTGKRGKFLYAYEASNLGESAVVVQTGKGKEMWGESEIYNLHKKAWR